MGKSLFEDLSLNNRFQSIFRTCQVPRHYSNVGQARARCLASCSTSITAG